MPKTVSVALLFLLVIGTLTFASKIQSVKAATITVPDDYPTIQAAIDAASDNDTVFVKSGYYHETVNVNRSISLVGEGWSTTIINGTGLGGSAVFVSGLKSVNITGFTVCCAGGEGISCDACYSYQYSVSITENTFRGCWPDLWINDTYCYHVCRNNFMDSYPTYSEGNLFSGRRSWNDSLIGNFWAIYNGSDLDQDGIGDTPYKIIGSSTQYDYHPLMNPWFHISGDINRDDKVNLQDLVLLADAYGSTPQIPSKWNPNADINGNRVVDLADLVILAQHYGQHNP